MLIVEVLLLACGIAFLGWGALFRNAPFVAIGAILFLAGLVL